MKPGDLAVVMCKREEHVHGKTALLIEWQKPPVAFKSSHWICLINGTEHSIPSGWLKVISEAR